MAPLPYRGSCPVALLEQDGIEAALRQVRRSGQTLRTAPMMTTGSSGTVPPRIDERQYEEHRSPIEECQYVRD